jgi:hypothetical protein
LSNHPDAFFSTRKNLNVTLSSRTIVFLVGVSACLPGGCIPAPPPQLAVWSEFVAYERVVEEIPTLAEFETELYLAVRPDDVGEPLWALLREAADHGVLVRLWLQLPEEGLWLNVSNVSQFGEFAIQIVQAAELEGVPVDWLIFDIEPSLELAVMLREATDDLVGLLRILRTQYDPDAFALAVEELSQLIVGLQQQGKQVMAVTLPWTIDDFIDGDADLQNFFNTPVAGIPWDEVSVIVYRTFLADLFGLPLSTAIVGRYATDARVLYHDRAEIAVGTIGTPGILVPRGYEDPRALARDISAAVNAGITRVSIYSLDGALELGGLRRWLSAFQNLPAVRPGIFAPFTDLVRALIRLADLVAPIFIQISDPDAAPVGP